MYKVYLIIISLKNNLFSPWYSWKIAELALNNNHLTSFLFSIFTKSIIIMLKIKILFDVNFYLIIGLSASFNFMHV